MLSTHSVLTNSTPVAIDAYANGFAGRGFGFAAPWAPLGRQRTKVAVPKPFRSAGQRQPALEDGIRAEEHHRKCARIVRKLHDTLLQRIPGASMPQRKAMEQIPADSPSMPAPKRALSLVRRAIDEGRAAIRGLQVTLPAPSSLEQAFADLLGEVRPARGVRLRMFVQGKPRTLKPVIQEQLLLIAREAVINALRHSEATNIDVEIQHLHNLLCVLVRDNGCGIRHELVATMMDSHLGLHSMRERAENIGARFVIWSRQHAGTEVCVEVPIDLAMVST